MNGELILSIATTTISALGAVMVGMNQSALVSLDKRMGKVESVLMRGK